MKRDNSYGKFQLINTEGMQEIENPPLENHRIISACKNSPYLLKDGSSKRNSNVINPFPGVSPTREV